MQKTSSNIYINYETVKITQSRINKGLLSIPVSLIEHFPNEKRKIQVFFDEQKTPELKNFTPYTSSSRECRIGGMAKWYKENKVKAGQEIVVVTINKEEGVYRLMKESNFKNYIKKSFNQLVSTMENEEEGHIVENTLEEMAQITNQSKKEILTGQFLKLKNVAIEKRKYEKVNTTKRKERVPYLMRKILEAVYDGRCQLTSFTFLQQNGKAYFEVHHIDENRGHDWKNLLVVSPNIHAQFTYGECTNYFYDRKGWLRKVDLCGETYLVMQLLDRIKAKHFEKNTHE